MEGPTVSITDKYVSVEPLEGTTGSDVQRQFARMQARLAARYRLSAVQGRPEELVSPEPTEGARRGISMGYGAKTIRVRLMAGREWIRTEDFQIADGWEDRLYSMCDTYFDYAGPDTKSRKLQIPKGQLVTEPRPKDPTDPRSEPRRDRI